MASLEKVRMSVDFIKILDYYGLEYKLYGNEIRTKCPIHEGSNNTSLRINLDNNMWCCYSNSCHEENYYNIIPDVFYFIQKMEEKKNGTRPKLSDAVFLAAKICKINLDGKQFELTKDEIDKIDNRRFIKIVKRYNREIKLINEELLKEFNMNIIHPYLLGRGYNDTDIKTFGIGFSKSGINEYESSKNIDFPGRIIFPIRNIDSNLVGLSGRLATDNDELLQKYKKYKHMYDFDRDLVLYNINNAIEYIRELGYIIVVEGFFDVIRLHQFGIGNVVAIMGGKITKGQIKQIIKNTYTVYLMFDADKGGYSGMEKAIKDLKNYCNVFRIELPPGEDPGSLTSAIQFWDAFSAAKKF